MPVVYETLEEMKSFLEFDDQDAARLKSLGPLFLPHSADITDGIVKHLTLFPATAGLLEGRVDSLRPRHQEWLQQLVSGEYGEAYFQHRLGIGLGFARAGVEARWVEGTMSLMRCQLLELLRHALPDRESFVEHCISLMKLMDIEQLILNLAYSEELFDRLCSATGMRRSLLNNLIRKAAKS